jgi:hypothetical protein
MIPSLSIILPVYNRVGLLAHPLDSLREASRQAPQVTWEVIVVDDGSSDDVRAVLTRYGDLPLHYHRQSNHGLLGARLAGLARSTGEAVCFLDADDAVELGKFSGQLDALLETGADVVHGDIARRTIDGTGVANGPLRFDPPVRVYEHPAAFYLELQPAPHDPIFRRSYLQAIVSAPLFPASRDYDPIAETWFYYQLSVKPAHIVRVPGAWSIVGEPAGERLSRKWERQCAAALRLMRTFHHSCPKGEDTRVARRILGQCAFSTWRALPVGFAPADQFLEIWSGCPSSPLAALGGRTFARAARFFGPVLAGRMFKFWQRPRYANARTVNDQELQRLFA